MTGSKCIVCGEYLLVGDICDGCAVDVLKNVKSKARLLSMVVTVSLLVLMFLVWSRFGPVLMGMDATAIRSYPMALGVSFDILRSPMMFPLAVVGGVLILFVIVYQVYYKRIFLDGSKSI